MSLSSALSSAVSSLTAQSLALSAISENIANSSTTAYKTKETSFDALVTGAMGSSTSISSVVAKQSQAMRVQGLVSSTSVATNAAIQGDGFFVVADSSTAKASEYAYSRNGSFAADASGYLVNSEGYYLMGFPTDSDGNVLAANTNDISNLKPINVSSISGTAEATDKVTMSANLPADAAVGDSFTSSMTVIDSLGVSQTIDQTWTKTAANSWTLALANPYASADTTATQTGTISPTSIDVTFDSNGVLASTNPDPIALSISGYTSGAADGAITLNLGTVGGTDGLTQYASTTSTPAIENPTVEANGSRYGQLSSVTIGADGLVTAAFDNGLSVTIYKVPVATFNNPNGLTQISGTVYDENQAAGQVALSWAGTGGAGSLVASALEGSATDTATEFNKMIVAQQAYSAASQVVTTAKDMFDSLLQAVR
ncbi:flagellar hook protein FlgE [Phenylobacterium aquaticum]|jgi:flagellar hook protein FlgE|uniref:flagellar hook protein FlgE n=1 Tax=Phenylobacterium aquaticum TaxID=1763816 RepID=UPI001F5D0702|nr:flagellar hook protein FlgE [Phenylobacterium aquaticum]MCI3131587.1 flagellar hook protein FlgE [Phenylobacterium aquaticum]